MTVCKQGRVRVMAASPVPDGTPEARSEPLSVGHSLRAIAEVVGSSKSTVQRDTAKVENKPGAVRGRDGKLYAAEKVRVKRATLHLQLRAEGLSERAIAQRTGWPHSTVHRDLADFTLDTTEEGA